MPQDPNEASSFAETLHRHDPDPSQWDEAQGVTGRPVDKAGPNSTLASRAAESKAVKPSQVENKAVTEAENKAPAKSATKAEWVAYAVAQGMDPAEAEAKSKNDLVDQFG